MNTTYTYLFGPVVSRRFGRSLGIDIVPFKTCSQNCIFCQLGEGAAVTTERREYVPLAQVLHEMDDWQAQGNTADVLTLSGSGEPTLHTGFGEVLRHAKKMGQIPTLLLTNGSLLHLPEVRRDACDADIAKMTLSAWDQASYEMIHRAQSPTGFDELLRGEQAFRKEFSGALHVEVFLIEGVNSELEQVKKMAEIVDSLNPDLVQLNTAVRPPAQSWVRAVCAERLAELAPLFSSPTSVPSTTNSAVGRHETLTKDVLMSLCQRHPTALSTIAVQYEVALVQVEQWAAALCEERRAVLRSNGEESFLIPVEP